MSFAESGEFEDLEFRVGFCAECEREVLTYLSYGSEGGEQCCCVHCDVPLRAATRPARGADLPDAGYGLLELQGCGNPDCGGGRCGQVMMKESAAAQEDGGEGE